MLACVCGLGLLAFVMCAPHIGSGGLYYDDWSLLALARFPAPGGLLHSLWLDYGQRPGQVLYYAALDSVIGMHPGARLALAALMLVLEASCLYALLRWLDLAVRDAAAIAVLLLVFPFSDSTWLWGVMSLSGLTIAAGLLGTILALWAFRSSGRSALALHGASLALYLMSVLSYEVFAPAGCLAGLLYVRAVGLRRARARWSLDVLAIVSALALTRLVLPIDVATPSNIQSLAGMTAHAGLIAGRGARLIGAAVLPVTGLSPWAGLALLVAVVVVAAGLRMRLAAGDPIRGELARWLGIAGAGALVAMASWAAYVPGPDHYAPSVAGTVNRMNAAAALGIATLVYAAAVLCARTLSRLLRLPVLAGSLALAAATLALVGAYLGRAFTDARSWDAAAADQRQVLADLRAALPRLPMQATVYAVDAPQIVGPGIPVLNTTLDLTSAMRISYSSPMLVGVALSGPMSMSCSAYQRVGAPAGSPTGARRSAYLVDVDARRAVALRCNG